MDAGITTPWQTLEITSAITPIGQLASLRPRLLLFQGT